MGLKCIMMTGQFVLSLSSSFVCLLFQTNSLIVQNFSIQNIYSSYNVS